VVSEVHEGPVVQFCVGLRRMKQGSGLDSVIWLSFSLVRVQQIIWHWVPLRGLQVIQLNSLTLRCVSQVTERTQCGSYREDCQSYDDSEKQLDEGLTSPDTALK